MLIDQPLFAAAAIGSLALGIGLNVTIFSVVNAVLLRGQPVERARTARRDLQRPQQGLPAAHDVVSGLPGHRTRRRRARRCDGQQLSCAASSRPAASGSLITGESVTANYFDLLGIPLAARPRLPRRREPHAERGARDRGEPRSLATLVSAEPPPSSAQTVKISGSRLHGHRRGVRRISPGCCPASPPTSGCR